MDRAGVDLPMNLVLARTESELTRAPNQDDRVLWLGSMPIPKSLRSHAVALPADPPALEGWLAIRRLGDELVGGRSVKQALDFEGVSLWWFVHHWLVYGKGLTGWDERYRVLRRVIAGLDVAPEGMVLLSRRAEDDLVARAVAEQRVIPYRWAVPIWTSLRGRFLLRWRAQALMGARLAKLLLRGLLARLMRKNSLSGRGPIDFLFHTSSSSWDAKRGIDRLLTPLLEEAGRRGLSVVGLHLDYRRNLGLDTLFQLDRRIVAWESLVTPTLALRAKRRGRRIARSLGGELPGDVLGIPVARLLADRVAVLGPRLSDAVLAIETSRRALDFLRPRCLYVMDAYDLWALALVVAARDAGVRSVEVQHGIIEKNHSGYLHLDSEIAPDRNQRSPYSPIADVIVVHGEGAREALIEQGHFPPDTIHVTGSPNIAAARNRQGDQRAIRARLGLTEDTVVVLYFGAPQHVHPVDVEHLRTFLDCCRSMHRIKPVLRPHPSDQGGPGRYRAAAMAAGIEAPVLTEADPFELILAADVVISYNSTTALDAMALERPVIQINMSGLPDLFRFVDDGGAVSARNVGELRAALLTLSSPEARVRLVSRHVPYAGHYYAQCADPAREMLEVGFPRGKA
jgi:hypothetical protein